LSLLSPSTLQLLVLLVPVVLDHVLRTPHCTAKWGPVLALPAHPFHDVCALLVSNLVPPETRLEVVVPALTALFGVPRSVLSCDLNPVHLGRWAGIFGDEEFKPLAFLR
jgi:hypothetical protein